MRIAHIKNGTVVNISVAANARDIPADGVLLQGVNADAAEIGDTYNGVSFNKPARSADDLAKEQARDAIKQVQAHLTTQQVFVNFQGKLPTDIETYIRSVFPDATPAQLELFSFLFINAIRGIKAAR